MMGIIFVLFSVWITAFVIKWVFRGFKRLLSGAPKQGIEEKQKQNSYFFWWKAPEESKRKSPSFKPRKGKKYDNKKEV